MTRPLIIVRTHRADAASLAAFDLFASLPGFDTVFCVDERTAVADMQGRDKVAYNNDVLKNLDLYSHPNCGWQCGDYCYHVTRTARPDHEFYWLIEPDVRIHTGDLAGFFAQFAGSRADLLAPRFGPRNDVWWWTRTIRPLGMEPYGCLFPITRLSGRGIDHVLRERQRLSADPAVATRDNWPNDEAMTATALMDGGFECRDLNHGGLVCHDRNSLGAGAIVDYALVSAGPPNGMIYHPVRAFAPWLERTEARIVAVDRDRSTRHKVLRLRAEASQLGSVSAACVRHPEFFDSALVPLLVADSLWRERPWIALGSTEQEAGDRHEAGMIANRLARRFGPGRNRPQVGTAHLARCRTGTDRMTVAATEDFTLGPAVPIGHFPRNVALPYAWDLDRQELLFTLHVGLSGVLAAPFLYAGQREMARAVARIKLAALPRIYGPPDPDAAPVLIFSLGRTGSTLLEKLIGCVTARSISEPDAITQIAIHRRKFAELDAQEQQGMIAYAIVPFFHVQIPGAEEARCVIKFRSQVNALAGPVAQVFAKAKYVFMVRERTAWARSTFRAFRLSPAAVVERLLQGLQSVQTLRQAGVDLSVIAYEDMVADPRAAVSSLTGTDIAGNPALAARIAETMAQDSQADHRLSRDATSKKAEGEDEWMERFAALWAERRPGALLDELDLAGLVG